MNRSAAEILEEARQLPPSEREWVAHGLLMDSPDEMDPDWAAEVERRVADAASPNAVTGSWEDLESQLRARLPQ